MPVMQRCITGISIYSEISVIYSRYCYDLKLNGEIKKGIAMIHKRQIIILLGLAFFIFAFQSCSTTIPYSRELPEVTISHVMDQKDKLKIIRNPYINPYIEPSTTIRGKLNEFFVIKIDFNLEQDTRIEIVAEMNLVNDTSVVAYPYDREQFITYWEMFASHDLVEDNLEYTKKINTILRTCIPSYIFTQKAGRSTFYLPFIGKNPLSRPAKVSVQVYTSNQIPLKFSYVVE